MKLRNVAIVAHVDHGKTTLVDGLFKEAGTLGRGEVGADRLMDSDVLERERGITILSKNATVDWKGVRVNLIDTPGHADFGGQVERVLSMADGVLLLVDAFEGVMPQTRFVLKKSFEAGLRPLVVVNKMDRQDARPDAVLGEVFDLFVDLGAEELALDFPVIYASARSGWASREEAVEGDGFACLLDDILKYVPAPQTDEDAPMRFQVSTLDWDDYVGRIGIGKVDRGVIRKGMPVSVLTANAKPRIAKIKELYRIEGMGRVDVESVSAGDIAAISGISDAGLGDSICDLEAPEPLPFLHVEDPTIEMEFLVNDSPLAGRVGQFVTSRQVLERLEKAEMMDPALRVTLLDGGGCLVGGRGVLHLGILIENMRREGFEFSVGKPRVLLQEQDGKKMEPLEAAVVECPEDSMGKVIEYFGGRGAEIRSMDRRGSRVSLNMTVPTRGLLGARTQVLTLTRGEGNVSSVFEGWVPMTDGLGARHNGVLVANEAGKVTAYSLRAFEDRGTFFVGPGVEVYEGMILGENNKDKDIVLNIIREKKLTNVRSAGKDNDDKLRRPRDMGLEACLEFLDDDELLEVGPTFLRLRKRLRREKMRLRAQES
jgi:GTP-binding protein